MLQSGKPSDSEGFFVPDELAPAVALREGMAFGTDEYCRQKSLQVLKAFFVSDELASAVAFGTKCGLIW